MTFEINQEVWWSFDGWSHMRRVITDKYEDTSGTIYVLDNAFTAREDELERPHNYV